PDARADARAWAARHRGGRAQDDGAAQAAEVMRVRLVRPAVRTARAEPALAPAGHRVPVIAAVSRSADASTRLSALSMRPCARRRRTSRRIARRLARQAQAAEHPATRTPRANRAMAAVAP